MNSRTRDTALTDSRVNDVTWLITIIDHMEPYMWIQNYNSDCRYEHVQLLNSSVPCSLAAMRLCHVHTLSSHSLRHTTSAPCLAVSFDKARKQTVVKKIVSVVFIVFSPFFFNQKRSVERFWMNKSQLFRQISCLSLHINQLMGRKNRALCNSIFFCAEFFWQFFFRIMKIVFQAFQNF